jgi:exonuclease SbcD
VVIIDGEEFHRLMTDFPALKDVKFEALELDPDGRRCDGRLNARRRESHTADLHLGFSQFNRVDATGRNIRELDVTASFRALVDRVIAIAPDVMVIAGDVLHSVRPKNPVVIEAFIEFKRLADALPRMPIVMVAGNHDFPRAADTGCLLPLFRELGVTVVDRDAQKLVFRS